MDGCFVTLMRTSSDSLGVQWERKPGEMGGGMAFQGKSEKASFQKAVDLRNPGQLRKEMSVRNCESVKRQCPWFFLRNLPMKKLSNQTPALKHWLCLHRAHRVPTIPRLWHWIYLSSPSSQWNLSCCAFSVTTSLQDWSFLKWQLS